MAVEDGLAVEDGEAVAAGAAVGWTGWPSSEPPGVGDGNATVWPETVMLSTVRLPCWDTTWPDPSTAAVSTSRLSSGAPVPAWPATRVTVDSSAPALTGDSPPALSR